MTGAGRVSPTFDARDVDLNALRSLAMVVRSGSVPRAARALGSSTSTVGRHLRYLEDLCGDTLFDRTANGLRINDRGRALADSAEALRNAADALLRALKNQQVAITGVLRVAASHLCSAKFLSATFAGLRPAFPGLDIEIQRFNATELVLDQTADLFVTPDPRPDLVEVAAFPDLVLRLFGSRPLLDRLGSVDDVADLHGVAVITPTDETVVERLRTDLRVGDREPRIVLMTDSLPVRLDGALAGKALSLLDTADAAAHPDLIAVLPDFAVHRPLRLAIRPDAGRNVRAAVAHLGWPLAAAADA